jgi:hypothetical protein
LQPLSIRSRDNLPNPQHRGDNAYMPSNRPAIGVLMSLFNLERDNDRDGDND